MKTARTAMLLPPSMQECVKVAVEWGMPEAEGRKFFYHYDSKGWKVGREPMKSFASAMGGWHERWLERTTNGRANGGRYNRENSRNAGVVRGPTNYGEAARRKITQQNGVDGPMAADENNPPTGSGNA